MLEMDWRVESGAADILMFYFLAFWAASNFPLSMIKGFENKSIVYDLQVLFGWIKISNKAYAVDRFAVCILPRSLALVCFLLTNGSADMPLYWLSFDFFFILFLTFVGMTAILARVRQFQVCVFVEQVKECRLVRGREIVKETL